MNADSVDRFAEPFGALFASMWEEMRRGALVSGGATGMVSKGGERLAFEAYTGDYCVSAGVSGRTANQWQILQGITQAVVPMVQVFPNIAQFVQAGPLGRWIFDLVDSELSRAVFVDGGQGAPIEQTVAQLGQIVGMHHKYLAAMAQEDAGAGAGGGVPPPQ
jgi:hypothetical protein